MKNYEEVTRDLLVRRDRYVTEQKKKRKRMMGVAASFGCFCLAALLGVGVWHSVMQTKPPITPDNNSTISDNHGKDDYTTPGNQDGEQSNPPANSKEDNTAPSGNNPANPGGGNSSSGNPSGNNPSNPSGGNSSGNNPSNPSGGNSSSGNPSGNNPAAELAYRTVSYQEAKELFGYPIIECLDENFVNYSIGVVSQNCTVCNYSSVVYSFTNGIRITLFNQEIAILYFGEDEDLVKRVEYNGHTFLIDEHASPDEQQYYIRIGYFPNQESGICYIADVTDETIEQTEIMDSIISLEIK